ncbi:MAG: flagellar biosynthesis protein FlhB [Chloroflexi bacterium]|nr:flagellar biosynthesis protein FlhB [Chloroflexota bacterium]
MAQEAGKAHVRTRAVALRYDEAIAPAPVVTAAGRGEVAERILALAREHGIAIREDPDLVALLAQLDVGQIVPSELYPVIAEVLSYVYRLRGYVAGEAAR